MSRWDLTGLFWDDYIAPKEKVEKPKRTPPEPTWLLDDYLPYLDEAKAHVFDLYTDAELMTAASRKERLAWDIEMYPNFGLLGAAGIETRKVVKFEGHEDGALEQLDKLKWVMQNFLVVGFNDNNFDVPMMHAILMGYGTDYLTKCADWLINGNELNPMGMRPNEFYKHAGVDNMFYVNNIDLIDLNPLSPSLKICSGRMGARRMADLPFKPGKWLSPDQKTILRYYWQNDLDNTADLYLQHKTAIELREVLSAEYGTDVRSKSDPQIAEAIIRKEVLHLTKQKYIQRAEIRSGATFKYKAPAYLQFKTPLMKWVLETVCTQDFEIDAWGSPQMSSILADLVIEIGEGQYQMGIGGLHSKEKRVVHIANDGEEITDNDVTSYYPSLIIQQGMFPPNVGPAFLQVFAAIVTRRVKAKRNGDKKTAETLKIVANGTFGKTGERGGYSVVYFPEMMVQVTVTGQLSLLLLIEWLELAGIPIISANTDGITVKCPKHLTETRDAIMKEWEARTGLELEHKGYKSVYSRDVNNYVAFLTKPDEKEQGVWKYVKSVGAYRKVIGAYPLKWNPVCEVCKEALIDFLANGKSIDTYIRECSDFTKFVEVRRVTGGAVKDGEYLGKAIRWYYSTEAGGPIINAKNGNHVPRSDGARPCLTMPEHMPKDIDYEYYIQRALGMLDDFAPKVKKPKKQLTA